VSTAPSANIAQHLPRMAALQPDVPALKVPRGRTAGGDIDYLTLSFAELSAEAGAWQAEFAARGLRRGDRTLVMVRPGLPLIAAVFALFGLGAVPVVIDPGMGLKSFLACVARSRPRALVGIPLARVVSRVFRGAFRSVALRIPVAGSPVARGPAGRSAPFAVAPCAADELAALLFTSGSTGAPKGVCYTHGMFAAQVELIRATYDIQPGERDLPMLPVFALFNPALGMTTVVPEIDPARPAKVDPAKVVQAIRQEEITTSFGSPTLWWKIALYCREHDIALPTMRRVLSAGAPVPPGLWAAMRDLLPNGELHSPYGATEALPVSSIRARDVLARTAALTLRGHGTCVGTVIPGNEVRIVALTDDPVARLDDIRALPPGEIGEIVVRGPTVTHEYDALPAATAAAKIRGPDGAIWHRMGDCGHLDDEGRLWFCGRKAERVETREGPLHTEQVEPVFREHPQVARCALVGLGTPGAQTPALVVEKRMQKSAPPAADTDLVRELAALAAPHPYACRVRQVFFHPSLPVDVRHNAKIHRLTLARWAGKATGHSLTPPAASSSAAGPS
jgi:acyl-CoA synthetase (AMP-forming)/AMP-acid ligase II